MQNGIESDDGLRIRKQQCSECKKYVWRLFSVKVDYYDISVVKHMCARCRRRLNYSERGSKGLQPSLMPSQDCSLCGKPVCYDEHGVFVEVVKECQKCARIFCENCWKVENMVICVNRDRHWLCYSANA